MAQLPLIADPALTRWKSILDPIIGNQLLQGNYIQSISLNAGNNAIEHKLQRQPIGWIICDKTLSADLNRLSWDKNYITLLASSPTTINLWVF
jgi:hypothetical protein